MEKIYVICSVDYESSDIVFVTQRPEIVGKTMKDLLLGGKIWHLVVYEGELDQKNEKGWKEVASAEIILEDKEDGELTVIRFRGPADWLPKREVVSKRSWRRGEFVHRNRELSDKIDAQFFPPNVSITHSLDYFMECPACNNKGDVEHPCEACYRGLKVDVTNVPNDAVIIK